MNVNVNTTPKDTNTTTTHKPTVNKTGASAPVGTHCLFTTAQLIEVMNKAKSERATNGKTEAYAELLGHFHRAILPAFFVETSGNLSEVARLLGIHRGTIKEYAIAAGVDMTGACAAGGVA